MEEQVLNIVSSFVGKSIEELKNSINSDGVWDSLQKVEIVIALEDEFDVAFGQEEIAEINTISDFINKIQGKI